ncbi:MAG: hypothetical protein IMW98_01550 [Firmicutes bacterium]|nr:hypothetical protein [Bacillota bacterium]
MKGRMGEERGATVVLVALGMVALMGMAALSLDVGELVRVRAHLSDAAIAAALSAARELPDNPTAARQVAVAVAHANGAGDPVDVVISSSRSGGPLDRVTVTLHGHAAFRFAPVLGETGADVAQGATAQAGTVAGLRGAVPLGVEKGTYQYGQTYTLKSDDPLVPGNFGALALGGRGADNYRDNLQHGYAGVLQTGMQVETEPGNMSGPTQQGLQPRIDADPSATCATVQPGSPRLLYVPIVDFAGAHGRSTVPVVGFAAFFLSSTQKGEVTGCFLRLVTDGDWAPLDPAQDYGLRSVALIQ